MLSFSLISFGESHTVATIVPFARVRAQKNQYRVIDDESLIVWLVYCPIRDTSSADDDSIRPIERGREREKEETREGGEFEVACTSGQQLSPPSLRGAEPRRQSLRQLISQPANQPPRVAQHRGRRGFCDGRKQTQHTALFALYFRSRESPQDESRRRNRPIPSHRSVPSLAPYA